MADNIGDLFNKQTLSFLWQFRGKFLYKCGKFLHKLKCKKDKIRTPKTLIS
jgi:hypothetical protein